MSFHKVVIIYLMVDLMHLKSLTWPIFVKFYFINTTCLIKSTFFGLGRRQGLRSHEWFSVLLPVQEAFPVVPSPQLLDRRRKEKTSKRTFWNAQTQVVNESVANKIWFLVLVLVFVSFWFSPKECITASKIIYLDIIGSV